jgi:hypothetical protein
VLEGLVDRHRQYLVIISEIREVHLVAMLKTGGQALRLWLFHSFKQATLEKTAVTP